MNFPPATLNIWLSFWSTRVFCVLHMYNYHSQLKLTFCVAYFTKFSYIKTYRNLPTRLTGTTTPRYISSPLSSKKLTTTYQPREMILQKISDKNKDENTYDETAKTYQIYPSPFLKLCVLLLIFKEKLLLKSRTVH